jgi:hypothetical protein
MLTKIFTVAALILVLMVAIKDGRILRTSGLTGSCSVVQTAADGAQVEACRPGKLEGRPDLTRRGCTDTGKVGKSEYWRCPAAIEASQAGR